MEIPRGGQIELAGQRRPHRYTNMKVLEREVVALQASLKSEGGEAERTRLIHQIAQRQAEIVLRNAGYSAPRVSGYLVGNVK